MQMNFDLKIKIFSNISTFVIISNNYHFQYNYDNYLQKDLVLFDFDSLEIYRQAQHSEQFFPIYVYHCLASFSQKIIDNFSAYNCNITCALALPAPHDGRIQKLNLIFCL